MEVCCRYDGVSRVMAFRNILQNFASLLLCWLWGFEGCEDRFVKNILQAFLQMSKKINLNYHGLYCYLCLHTWVNAEHSTYLTAFNSFANFSPCSNVIGFCLFFASFSKVPFSSRRSICVPTSKNGVFWQWCVISGTHCNRKWLWIMQILFFPCDSPFLWRSQKNWDWRRRSIRGKHPSADKTEVWVDRSPPDLQTINIISAMWVIDFTPH